MNSQIVAIQEFVGPQKNAEFPWTLPCRLVTIKITFPVGVQATLSQEIALGLFVWEEKEDESWICFL